MKKKILVIEDDEDIRNLILFNLEMTEEYNLLQADNGEDGLVLAQKHIPALVILDVMLPGIDGFEVCRQLKAGSTTRKIPVVMLTARSDDNDVVKGFEIGVEDYLRKQGRFKHLSDDDVKVITDSRDKKWDFIRKNFNGA